MPPTRGHDLKLCYESDHLQVYHDAPHTGARLETRHSNGCVIKWAMPPTRGHDLKLARGRTSNSQFADAPHTGARLETKCIHTNAL